MKFRESKKYIKKSKKLLSEEERMELESVLIDRPDIGVIPSGWGGLRKMRFAVKGKGKSGGARIVYFWTSNEGTIFLLDIYPKNERDNLKPAEVKHLHRILEGLKPRG